MKCPVKCPILLDIGERCYHRKKEKEGEKEEIIRGGKRREMARPKEHKLGEKNQYLVDMVLIGHTHWHAVVSAARKGNKFELMHSLYQQQKLIENVIRRLHQIQ
jgi:hypothetical protein